MRGTSDGKTVKHLAGKLEVTDMVIDYSCTLLFGSRRRKPTAVERRKIKDRIEILMAQVKQSLHTVV